MTYPKSTYIPHLDVLRLLAAMMIIMLHAYEAWVGWYGQVGLLSNGNFKTLSSYGSWVDQFIRNFGHGVDVFFLISGFLITYLLLAEKKAHETISIGKFLIRRTLRIWPLYFLIIAHRTYFGLLVKRTHPKLYLESSFPGEFRCYFYPKMVIPV